jgi:uncharacterized protein
MRYLLDVNVLVALSWPDHVAHAVVRGWFARNSQKGWATCPLVQAGFVRIASNPAFSSRSISVQEATEGLRASLASEHHQFWPDSISLAEALQVATKPIKGHQQVTDAYLVALAVVHRGRLATLDRRIALFAPPGTVEVIG